METITTGAEAFAFVRAAAALLPGLVDGLGAPVLDRLLRVPGFVDEWRRSDDRALRRALGFRLAWLGLVEAGEVDPAGAESVATDLMNLDHAGLRRALETPLLDAAERIFAAHWRPALARAVLARSCGVAAPLVRRALGGAVEGVAALALSSDDLAAVLEGEHTPELTAAVIERALARDDVYASAARVQAFVYAARRGVTPPSELLRGATSMGGEYPADRWELVVEALELLSPEERARLLLAEARFPWAYIATSAAPRVVAEAVVALPADPLFLQKQPWAARAFAAWGAQGMAALTASVAPGSRALLEMLTDHAAHAPARRQLDDLPGALRQAIDAAMNALDADPAASPSRTLLDPVLTFGEREPEVSAGQWHAWRRWAPATVAAYVNLPKPILVDLLRKFTSFSPPPPVEAATPDPRVGHMLLALANAVAPVWRAARPDDEDFDRVLADARAVLQGAAPEAHDALDRLRAYIEAPLSDREAAAAAQMADWAHDHASSRGEIDIQDTPPTHALCALTADERDPARRARIARAFWESFLLTIVPAAARVTNRTTGPR